MWMKQEMHSFDANTCIYLLLHKFCYTTFWQAVFESDEFGYCYGRCWRLCSAIWPYNHCQSHRFGRDLIKQLWGCTIGLNQMAIALKWVQEPISKYEKQIQNQGNVKTMISKFKPLRNCPGGKNEHSLWIQYKTYVCAINKALHFTIYKYIDTTHSHTGDVKYKGTQSLLYSKENVMTCLSENSVLYDSST